ncbi:50S ribosomal protein L1 [Blattabacterium cuenoti]|uniref:50S ribosomal protein L1 n=1 Tax=Blattabacterium cuenoti TaxID=1653831 RepID=UPI00163CFC69|nr:50S ribosomal protein L1 [Blattabacterium cuenoti]
MSKKLTKNKKKYRDKISHNKKYSLEKAIEIIKKTNFVKFNASVDIAICLGIDPRLPDQMVRGSIKLPNGIGKNTIVLALVDQERELEAKESGADYVGLDYIEKIKSGWTDNIDVIVATPSVMNKLSILGKILGPKGLMPNPKMDTVSTDIKKSIEEFKYGKVFFKSDRYGIIHSSVGRISFSNQHLLENIKEFMRKIIQSKPSSSKGSYIKNVCLSSTMGSGSVSLDIKNFD